MTKPVTTFEECMRLMRSDDALTQEEGFWSLHPRANQYSAELISELEAETDDGLKGWLLELLAEAKAPHAIHSFQKYVTSSDEIQRDFAIRGLRDLNSPEAMMVLSRHGITRTAAEDLG